MTTSHRLIPVMAVALGVTLLMTKGVEVRDLRAAQQQRITVLYQNFPNPFPTAASPTTCLWFDLSTPSDVTLAVYDLRGHLVRTIVPSAQVPGSLDAGSYGRPFVGASSGCDPRFSWDGRASDGHSVPPGVYLARLHADGHWQTKKMVFRGP